LILDFIYYIYNGLYLRRVKVYNRLVEKYIFEQDQQPSRSGHVRMNVEISGTIKGRRLRLSIQILETKTHCGRMLPPPL